MKKYYCSMWLTLIGCFVMQSLWAQVKIKPIKGTFINLAYQDERNKYMDPQGFDNTDPELWKSKVRELHEMGIEYLVFMEVANEGKAYYPSNIMPWAYDKHQASPVDAIMDEAAALGMKVFMSIGWAKDQDDNLKNPETLQRQLLMMKELANLYGKHRALYGWYLPVEDCLCPVFAEHAVKAVNDLSRRARLLTPGKKIMISPYGIFDAAFGNPDFERQLAKVKVDIIAYQDEIGCVREPYPLPNLKKHWQLLRDIHNRLHIALWANCESFTWEGATNDRASALVPAAFPRLLSQLAIASEAPVDEIISFSVCGILDSPHSSYHLGQPFWSQKAYNDYMAWKNGDEYWNLLGTTMLQSVGNDADAMMMTDPKLCDGQVAEEAVDDAHWVKYERGYHEIVIDMKHAADVRSVLVRMLNCHKANVDLPPKVYLFASDDGTAYHLDAIQDAPYFANTKHDAWIDGVYFHHLSINSRYLKIAFNASQSVYVDEIYVNPSLLK